MPTNESSRVFMRRTGPGVATVWLADEDSHNAWSPALERDYYALLHELDADPDVRAIVVTGQGRHFCPGAAPDLIQSVVENGPQLNTRLSPTHLLALDTPLVAAVNGGCAGMGLLQALLCDARFVSAETRFSAAFTRRGLAGEHGVTWVLPRVLGLTRAMDLLVSGRKVTGEEAHAIGLATHLVPTDRLLSTAQEYAQDIADNCSPVSVALIRHQVWADLDRSLDDALSQCWNTMGTAWRSGHLTEGLASLRERRPARFDPLPPTLDARAATGHHIPHLPVPLLDEQGAEDEGVFQKWAAPGDL